MPVNDCHRGAAREFRDMRGTLAAWEVGKQLPFSVERLFAIYDVADGASRGDHAHRECHQLFVCFGGEVTIDVDDGHNRRVETLSHPGDYLHVPPMNWVRIPTVPKGATLLVLCSHKYDETDYIRDRDEFQQMSGGKL